MSARRGNSNSQQRLWFDGWKLSKLSIVNDFCVASPSTSFATPWHILRGDWTPNSEKVVCFFFLLHFMFDFEVIMIPMTIDWVNTHHPITQWMYYINQCVWPHRIIAAKKTLSLISPDIDDVGGYRFNRRIVNNTDPRVYGVYSKHLHIRYTYTTRNKPMSLIWILVWGADHAF